jgi:hypothetical protein
MPYQFTTPPSRQGKWGVEELGKKGEDKHPKITLTYPVFHVTI